MAMLETLEHLATWTGKDPAVVVADPFATMVMERATELVIEKAEIPSTWEVDPSLVPSRAKTICLLVAARTYTNRRSVISNSVGPISETLMAQMAAAMQLTEAEAEELAAMAGADNAYGGLWVISTTRGTDVPIIDNVNLPDSSGSDWLIPYAVEGETGAFDIMAAEDYDPIAFAALQQQVAALSSLVDSLDADKADLTYVTAQLALKAAQSALDAGLAAKANTADVNAALALKADEADLGPQIHLGDTPPATGSGELWADTTEA